MKKLLLITVSWIFWMTAMQAQDMTILSKAFDSSYIYENERKYEKAVAIMKKAYQEDSYEINLRLGWVTYLTGSYSESEAFYQKAIHLKPYAIEPRLGYVLPVSELGNWNLVIEQYNKILTVDPMNTLVNYRLGVIYYYRTQYDTALKYFEKVANLYPFDYDNTIMYAWASYMTGNLREAKVLFQKSLLIKPGDSSALEGLGLIK